jgi:hypothetical protein
VDAGGVVIPALIAAALFALLVVVFVIPVLRDNRARRKQQDAIEVSRVDPYWADMKRVLDEPRTALPWLDDPKSGGARIAALDPQQADRDYEASQAAGYVEELADYDLRRSLNIPSQTRTEQS